MPVPEEVLGLVERFENNLDAYRHSHYNETQVRREFIDPFFKALGWDIDNTQGYAEAYKDVVHEDALKVGGATKAPDYCFRIGGVRKFFLEAKKPSVWIKEKTAPAFQLRRYAWSAKLALSILTDFEEFAVYDCRVKPDKTDSPAKARVFYFTFREYPQRWDDIASIFSKEAVLKGSFDRYADTNKAKRGTAEVDAAFLAEIESWRELLARNIALRNPGLSQRELNFAVQQTIDRIIFLRICEARDIEPYGQLQSLMNGDNVYPRLRQIFHHADERYNSGLFHFRSEAGQAAPDELTLRLAIDDKPLKEIFGKLYYPDSPYAFSVLSATILGQVYEQFLGKVIRLTQGGQAKVEDKPEVKKAGGVYYTPTYIVEYIVKNTVGKLVEGKKLREVEKLHILDPACGSGSFLLVAYQYLLEWHIAWYSEHEPEKHARGRSPRIFKGQGGSWRLTTNERKRILLNNIFGVDIDPQAVEVTKLSLLLKVLEEESAETLGKNWSLFHERALPDLDANIKCGNSLISPDFYDGRFDFDEDEQRRINIFDWKAEFAEIFKAEGFDAVIGNPPYIFTRQQISEAERKYFSQHFNLSWEKHNTFMLFMETLLTLLNDSGRGAFIVPNSWLSIESGRLLRERLIKRLELVVDLNYPAFPHVSMEPCIFLVLGKETSRDVDVSRVTSQEEFATACFLQMKREVWLPPHFHIVLPESSVVAGIFETLRRNAKPLGNVFEVRTGLQAYEKGKGRPPQSENDVRDHVFDRNHKGNKDSIRYLEGRDVARFELSWSGTWMQYGPWLAQPREIGMFARPRILVREITAPLPYCLHATYVSEQYLNNKSVLNVLHPTDFIRDLKALSCILNSRLISIYYKNYAVKGARTVFPKVVIKNLREFPYPQTGEPNVMEELADLSDRISDLLLKRRMANTPHEKTGLQRQIDATDRRIDQLVYDLYGLTEEEIRIVEEGR